jgi:hypothetical protein
MNRAFGFSAEIGRFFHYSGRGWIMDDYGGTDTEKRRREKELANTRFEREEMGELLRLFSALGVTVAVGIVACFLLGLWVDGQLRGMGWRTYNVPKLGGVVLGLGMTMYWAYLRIVRHLRKYESGGTDNKP